MVKVKEVGDKKQLIFDGTVGGGEEAPVAAGTESAT
jgi:hypothetical protein